MVTAAALVARLSQAGHAFKARTQALALRTAVTESTSEVLSAMMAITTTMMAALHLALLSLASLAQEATVRDLMSARRFAVSAST